MISDIITSVCCLALSPHPISKWMGLGSIDAFSPIRITILFKKGKYSGLALESCE